MLLTVAMNLRAQENSSQATTRPILGRGIGKLTVDGTPSQTTTTIFISDDVITDTTTHVRVITTGSTMVFTPNSNFVAMKNAYRLKSGGSKVGTYTGLTAHLPNCYSVTPVNPVIMTLYEVNWSGSSALVYARSGDVRINYWGGGEPDPDKVRNPAQPDRGWIVQQGHMARISEVKLCKPLVDFWPQNIAPSVLGLAGASAASVLPPVLWNMSAESPSE